MTILMENEQELDLGFDYEKVLKLVIEKALEQEKCPYECEVNMTFTDNEGIRNINREFRELDVPTDVLSFPMVDYDSPADYDILESDDALAMYFNPESGELLLGDMLYPLRGLWNRQRHTVTRSKGRFVSLRLTVCFIFLDMTTWRMNKAWLWTKNSNKYLMHLG